MPVAKKSAQSSEKIEGETVSASSAVPQASSSARVKKPARVAKATENSLSKKNGVE